MPKESDIKLNPGYEYPTGSPEWYDETNWDKFTGGPYNFDYSEYFLLDYNDTNYTVTYVMPTGATTSSPTSYEYTEIAIPLDPCNCTGYDFDGWYTTSDFSGEAVTEIPACSMEELTFYAKMIPYECEVNINIGDGEIEYTEGEPTYKVYFSLNGVAAKAIAPIECSISNPIVLPETPVAEGYLFAGWFLDHDCTIPYNGNFYVEEDTILYAKWFDIASKKDKSYYIGTQYRTIESILNSTKLTSELHFGNTSDIDSNKAIYNYAPLD